MKTANEFYPECIDAYIAVCRRFGYTNGGALGNVVLEKRAEQSIRELLKFRPMIKAFGKDPVMYYYYVNGFAFAMGVVLAMLQANAPEKFAERDIIQTIINDPQTSPHELAFHTLQQFGMDPGIYNQLVQELYKKFQELEEPYRSAKEPRDYVLALFNAAFMTGCSVVIDKVNERRAQKAASAAAQQPEVVPAVAKPAAKKATPAAAKTAAKKATTAKKPAGRKPKTPKGT